MSCEKQDQEKEPEVIPVESISLDQPYAMVTVGGTVKLTATVYPDNATFKTVFWKSSDATVAEVYNGTVKAIKEGSATITASAGEQTATCVITVQHEMIPVESVSLNLTEITIEVGETEALLATVNPENADYDAVVWSSSDDAVAMVADGVVTAIAEGSAVITASAGGKSANCTVTVPHVEVPVESVSLNKTETTIEVGGSETLVATVNPSNADNPTVTWSSSNEAVATVVDGLVTAIAEGTAVITAQAGEKSATCTVTVPHVAVPVESVTLNKTETTIEVGGSETLTATVNPDNADDPTVTWSSSNEAVATVVNGLVSAVAEGTAVITASAGGKSATCTVTVPHVAVPVASVTLNKTETTIEVGGSETLIATVNPDNADDPTVTWSSSNEAVATVVNGLVSAVAEGTAVITASAGGKSATCTVTVPHVFIPVESITLNKTETTIQEGGVELLVATVNPTGADNATVTWTSSNNGVATVGSNGKVTAIAEGTAVITAEAGGKTATCTVTVTPADKTNSGTIDDLGGEETYDSLPDPEPDPEG